MNYMSISLADINECGSNPCDDHAICIYTPGSYNSSCMEGCSSDGTGDRRRCIAQNSEFPVLKFALGMSFGFLGLIIAATWLYFGIKARKLMTGRKPLSNTTTEDEKCLCMFFLISIKSNHLFQILDPRVHREGSLEQLQAIAELIKRCLKLHGKDRPTMREVTMELEGLRRFSNHPWIQPEVQEEAVGLMTEEESGDLYTVTISPEPSTGPYTM